MTTASAEKEKLPPEKPAEPWAHLLPGRLKERQFLRVRGREAVLRHQPELHALANRCGQTGAVDHLDYFLSDPYFGAKVPHLLLLRGDEGALAAAVLLYEYLLWGVPTGFFIPADLGGEWTVLAPQSARLAVARAAAESLLNSGSFLVLVSLMNADVPLNLSSRDASQQGGAFTEATQTRILRRTLRLESSYEATLAALGVRSRRNLRYARRRAAAQLRATYYEAADISEDEFLALNRSSAYGVRDWVARLRYRTARAMQNGVLAGVRAADGQWLSLIGGRRQGTTTLIDWQMNRRDLPSLSLGTAVRAFLLEDEVERGTQLLRFEGGTPHSMRSAFVAETVGDLLLARRFLSPAVLRKLPTLLPERSLLSQTLQSPLLQWRG